MQVIIDIDVLNDPGSHGEIDRIAHLFEDEWHLWSIGNPDEIEQCGWLNARPHWRKMFEEVVRTSVYLGSTAIHQKVLVVSNKANPGCCLPSVARRALSECVWVLMENRNTDGGAFLDTVLDLLGPPELLKIRSLKPPPLRYDSAGGNAELKKLIDSYIADPKWKGIPRRIVVFTDSDAKVPGKPSEQARDVVRHCAKNNIPCVMLSKRNIENYIPDAAIDAWVSQPGFNAFLDRFKALKRLSVQQRDHYPMKEGFSQTRPDAKAMTPDEEVFYASVSTDDRLDLDEGFSSKIVYSLRAPGDPSRPSSAITGSDLQARDSKGELDQLVSKIMQEL